MFTDPTFTLADQLFWIVDVFLKSMAPEACKRRVGLFSVAIWSRVKVFERRFSSLYAQWKAGTLPKGRAGAGAAATPHPGPPPQGGRELAAGAAAAAFDPMACDAASCDRARLRPASVLPRAFAWLHTLLPVSAPPLGGGIESLITNIPEMQALVAEVPEVGRMLRPICRMVGLKLPDYLALPRRKRVRKRKTPHRLSEADEEELRRLTARFPDTPPARSAKRVLRRMFEGKPVDLTKLSPVALEYVLHPPRDDSCPPPEIGYGGRWPRLPKDYVRPKDRGGKRKKGLDSGFRRNDG
jgi:hypothetical protein